MPEKSLSALFEPKSFWIYSDGSAITSGARTGSYAAMIIGPNDALIFVAGACCETTINRMELQAINSAIYKISEILSGIHHGAKLNIVTDSELTAKIITKEYGRKKNLDLWAQFDALTSGFDEVAVFHKSRNTEPAQAQADAICHIIRTEFSSLIANITSHDGFNSFAVSRDVRFQSSPAGGGGAGDVRLMCEKIFTKEMMERANEIFQKMGEYHGLREVKNTVVGPGIHIIEANAGKEMDSSYCAYMLLAIFNSQKEARHA